MDEMQHISKTVLSQVVIHMLGSIFEMHRSLSIMQKEQKTEAKLVFEIYFAHCEWNMSQKPAWRYATHVDGWNQNLRSMSTKCGMFVIHILFSSVVWHLHNSLVDFGFWPTVLSVCLWHDVLSVVCLSSVTFCIVVKRYVLAKKCSLRYILHVVNGTYLTNQHVTNFLFGDMWRTLMGEVKIYDSCPQNMGCFPCMFCFRLSCDASTTTWWILVFEICVVWMKCVTDETQHISKSVQVIVDMARPGFEMHCPWVQHKNRGKMGLWDICCTLTTCEGNISKSRLHPCILIACVRMHVTQMPLDGEGVTCRRQRLVEQRAVVGKKTAHLLPFSPNCPKSYSGQTPASAKWWRTGSLPPSRMKSAGGHARACPPRVNKMMMFAKNFLPWRMTHQVIFRSLLIFMLSCLVVEQRTVLYHRQCSMNDQSANVNISHFLQLKYNSANNIH